MNNFQQQTSQPRLGRTHHIHFVGIGGAGMSGIAEVLLNLGYQVSGSDRAGNSSTQRLTELGAIIYFGHAPENIHGSDVVVYSTVIPDINPELVAARTQRIPVIRRAEMLAELMRFQYGIAIAGTHGKTTTTSLVASLLSEGGLDPTYVIGGKLNSSGTHARLGTSHYFVAEADESDASFLHLQPSVAVVTNIDADHMETYHGDFAKLRLAFLEFLHHLPFYGLAIVCSDDPVIAGMLNDISRPLLTYGFNAQAHYCATNMTQVGTRCHFTVKRPEPYPPIDITLNMPGRHNVLNALAAIAIATEHGVDEGAITRALSQFAGVGRRLQQHGEFALPTGKALLIDDYGHHPREIEVTLAAIRAAWPDKRLVVVYQPHRYSRTAALWGDFAAVLATADVLFLMDIYPANEAPIAGIDSQRLLESIATKTENPLVHVAQGEDLLPLLLEQLHDNDVVLLQGAGDIGAMVGKLAAQFAELTTHTV